MVPGRYTSISKNYLERAVWSFQEGLEKEYL